MSIIVDLEREDVEQSLFNIVLAATVGIDAHGIGDVMYITEEVAVSNGTNSRTGIKE